MELYFFHKNPSPHRCLLQAGAVPVDLRDSNGRHYFMPFTPTFHLESSYPSWFLDYDTVGTAKGANCCSDYPVSFHYITGAEMLSIDYLLYSVKISAHDEKALGTLAPKDTLNATLGVNFRNLLDSKYHFDERDRSKLDFPRARIRRRPECSRIFALLDQDGDEQLSIDDYRKLIANVANATVAATVEKIFSFDYHDHSRVEESFDLLVDYCDVSGNGYVDEMEFTQAVCTKKVIDSFRDIFS